MLGLYLLIIIAVISLWFPGSVRAGDGLTLALGGDTMLARLVDQQIPIKDSNDFFGDVAPLLAGADVALVNLECAITNHGTMHDPGKTFHFRARPEAIQILKSAGIDIVSLANNHTMDYGPTGLIDTITYLERAGILRTGAGRTRTEAFRAAIDNKHRVAVLGLTDNMPEWLAGEEGAGTAYDELHQLPSPVEQRIRELKESSHLVVLSLHWGPNWVNRPPAQYRALAHKAIEAGVDIIHGHSPHTLQGIEIYRGKPIFYSLGDLIDDYAIKRAFRNDLGVIATLNYDKGLLRNITLSPTKIWAFQVNRARGHDFNWVKKTLTLLSKELGTTIKKQGDQLIISF